MDAFKHLEKAVERALVDLGKAPDGSPSQAPYSTRTSPVPGVVATATELLRSLATHSPAVENPRKSASLLSEAPDNQECTFKMSPDQLGAVLWFLQNALRQYRRSQNNG